MAYPAGMWQFCSGITAFTEVGRPGEK